MERWIALGCLWLVMLFFLAVGCTAHVVSILEH
jgi:hypothetical protein